MIYLANSREMKAIDGYSIQTVGIPSMVLMERAALAAALRIREALEGAGAPDSGCWGGAACAGGENACCAVPGLAIGATACGGAKNVAPRIVAVCGSGNNGGDGLAVARILHTWGYEVSWYMAGDAAKATPETKQQMEILKNLGIGECAYPGGLYGADVIVDAIFGIGLTREVGGHFAEVIETINQCRALVCAVDIPSGVCTDTGKVLGCAVRADMTVTFGENKLGLVLYPGAQLAGHVYVENIGFAPSAARKAGIHTFAYEKTDIAAGLPKRQAYSNKGTYGKVLVIAGSPDMAGACYFSARAAYGCGCGLVRVFTVRENHDVLLQKLPEAVLTTYDHRHVDFSLLQDALSWADSVVLGPGLSTEAYALDIVSYTLKNCRVPLVMDADGLNLLAKNPYLWEQVPKNTVLTPHIGEMARLMERSPGDIAGNLLEVCQSFSGDHHVICALKDARTVISDGQEIYINLSGNHGMATGGSGDVLSGIIGGLLAGGLKPLTAASFGCFIHGCAGDEACKAKGAYGLLASDIIQYMSKVIRQ